MYRGDSSIKQSSRWSNVQRALLPMLLLGTILCYLPQVAYSQRERSSFFYSNGQKARVVISLNSIGILAKEGVPVEQVDTLAYRLKLTLSRELPDGIFVLGLKDTLSVARLTAYAWEIKDRHIDIVAQSGLIVTPIGEKIPLILTDEFIVKFLPEVEKAQIEELNNANGVEIVAKNPFVDNEFLLMITRVSGTNALEMANRYHEHALTEFALPNFIHVTEWQQLIPNDVLFGNQWHLLNTGQGGGTIDADIDAELAWGITTGSPNVVIAVIDQAFDMAHPDLTANFWTNPGEIADNGVDDDANGFVDDVNGWDFRGGDNDPSPASVNHNHGTPVAGVAAACVNNPSSANAIGVAGSCPGCALMLIRKGNTPFADEQAFEYARAMGADIITNSWLYTIYSYLPQNVRDAINDATATGIVVLFAAGNNNNLNVCSGQYQNSIVSLPNIIAVSSSTNRDRKAIGGVYDGCSIGDCVDILAPSFHGDPGARGITTTDRTGADGYNNFNSMCTGGQGEPSDLDYTNCFGGTSSATPLTAGVVGLIRSVNQTLTREQIQRLIQDTADKIEPGVAAYADNTGFSSPATGIATHSWGRLNAFEAVRIAAPKRVGGKEGVDIFFRDNQLDWGNTEQPSNTLFESVRGFIGHWQSMDIKVDAPPYRTAPTAATFDAFADENPSVNSADVNKVYVRVRNRGPETASSVIVKLFWTQFGTALPPLPQDFWGVWPSNSANTTQWHPLNCSGSNSSTCTIANLAYSGSSVAATADDAAQIVPFDFPAPAPDPELADHFCLLAMIDSWQDTILPESRSAPIPSDFVVDILTPTDNNVTHRNYCNIITSRAAGFERRFVVRNPAVQPVQIILNVDAPDGWSIGVDTLAFNQPISLESGQEVFVTMKATLPKQNLSGDVTITQIRTDVRPPEVMGGVTYRFSSAPSLYYFSLSIHGGTAIPIGTLADDFKTSYNLLADIDYHFSPRIALVGLFGYNDFKSKTAGIDDTYWINLSLNLRYYWPIQLLPGPLSVYFGAGPGMYIPKDNDIDFGANAGFGFTYPFRPNIHLEIGADYLWIFDPDLQFTHSHAGFVFRF